MRQRLILHIGSHKTGSTALQILLAQNRRRLKRAGVLFPRRIMRPGLIGGVHSDLRDAALRVAGYAAPGGPGSPDLDALLDAYGDRIARSGAKAAILSCEDWSRPKNLFAPGLARLGARFDVQAIYFARRADAYAESLYRQLVRNQRLGDVSCKRYAETRAATWLGERSRMLDFWADAFGADAVTAIPYEPAVPGFDVAAAFFAAAGLGDVAQAIGPPRRRANPSLSRVQTEFVRRANAEGLRLSWAQMQALRRFGRAPGGFLGDTTRRRIAAATADDLERMRRRYVRDGRQTFFPAPPEREPGQAEDWEQRIDPDFERRLRRLLFLPPPEPG